MSEEHVFIYHLPYLLLKNLCKLLDQDDKWKELAGHMNYNLQTVQLLKMEKERGNSPTEELLTMWGHLNHTVSELFVLLSRMQHYKAMMHIKEFVSKRYHRLLYEGETNLAANKLSDMKLNNIEQCAINYGVSNENVNLNMGDKKIAEKHSTKIELPMLVNRGIEIIVENDSGTIVTKDENDTVLDEEPNRLTPNSLYPMARNVSTLSNISSVSGASVPFIEYSQLEKATNNWHESTVLGKGGFGTVFKGNFKCTEVAIKRIEQRDSQPNGHEIQLKQSTTELQCLNAYRHDNILPLYGYSYGDGYPCLIYQYMPGGCLEQRLRTKDSAKLLDWHKRTNIAIGSARGLQFLHTIGTKPLIHGDIKSANILLDQNDTPKLGDFGLAREGPQNNYTYMKVSRIQGTIPYLPDEFLRAKKFSPKLDTFSFGVVLFEIATGRSAGVRVFNDRDNKYHNRFLKDDVWGHVGDIVELMDRRLPNGEIYFRDLIDIGKLCTSFDPKARPDMIKVLIDLEQVLVKAGHEA